MKQHCTYCLHQVISLIYNLLCVLPVRCIFGNFLQDSKDFGVQYLQALKQSQHMVKIYNQNNTITRPTKHDSTLCSVLWIVRVFKCKINKMTRPETHNSVLDGTGICQNKKLPLADSLTAILSILNAKLKQQKLQV